MYRTKRSPGRELNDLVQFLTWGDIAAHHVFSEGRTFARDEDLRRRRTDRSPAAQAHRFIHAVVVMVRRIEATHDFVPFDLARVAIVAGDTDRVWLARCVRAVNAWLNACLA